MNNNIDMSSIKNAFDEAIFNLENADENIKNIDFALTKLGFSKLNSTNKFVHRYIYNTDKNEIKIHISEGYLYLIINDNWDERISLSKSTAQEIINSIIYRIKNYYDITESKEEPEMKSNKFLKTIRNILLYWCILTGFLGNIAFILKLLSK